MARYAVFACDQMYDGLHGMNYTGVVEADSVGEIAGFAFEEALYVIQSYANIYEALDEEAEECIEEGMTEDEIEELRNDIYINDVQTTWALVDESVAKNYTTEELDNMCYNMTYTDFVEQYCIKDD